MSRPTGQKPSPLQNQVPAAGAKLLLLGKSSQPSARRGAGTPRGKAGDAGTQGVFRTKEELGEEERQEGKKQKQSP